MPIGIRMAFGGELGMLKELRGDFQVPVRLDILAKRDVREAIEGIIRETDEAIGPLPHVWCEVSIVIEKHVELSLERIFINIPLASRSVADGIDLRPRLRLRLRDGKCPRQQVIATLNQLRELRLRIILGMGAGGDHRQPTQ